MLDTGDLLVAGVQIWIWEKYLNLNLTLSRSTFILDWISHSYKQHVAHGRKKTHILINNALWNKGEKVYRKFKRIRNRPEVIIFSSFRNSWTQYLESEFEQSKIADFLEIRKRKLKDSFVLDPVFTNQAYKNFETLSQTKLRHPCSTGFIGMFLMSRSCRSVSAFGFCNSKTHGNYRTMWHDYKNEHKVYEMWSRDVHFNLTLYPPPLWYRLKHPAACCVYVQWRI